jgi:DNA-binding IclR family transcriptional regulator
MRTNTDQDSVQSVRRALAIIDTLVQSGRPMTVKDIAERLDLNRTTVHRFVSTLMAEDWVERAPQSGYQLSIKFLAMGHVANQQRDFVSEIRPELLRLSQLSRETVHVAILDGVDVVHIDKIESLERVGVSSRIGTRAVIHRTSLGKAFVAALPDDEIRSLIVQANRRGGDARIGDEAGFWAEITRTRARGYSIDDEEDSTGVRCMGVAVRGPSGAPILAVSVTGPSPRFTREHCAQLAPELMRSGERMSAQFGYTPASLESLEPQIA